MDNSLQATLSVVHKRVLSLQRQSALVGFLVGFMASTGLWALSEQTYLLSAALLLLCFGLLVALYFLSRMQTVLLDTLVRYTKQLTGIIQDL